MQAYRDPQLLDRVRGGLLHALHRLRLDTIRHHCGESWTPQPLAAGLAAGTVAGFFDDILFDASRTYSVEEAAAAVGADPEVIRELGIAFGFTAEMRDHDVAMLEMFKTIADSGLPVDAMLEGARVMGDSLRRIAETEVRLLHVHVHERLTAAGVADDEVTRQIFEIQEVLTPLLDPLIQHVHRHHLMAAIIEDVFMHLTSSNAVPTTLGSVQATIVFADFASFTEFAESEGDEAAARVLERLDAAVRALTLEHEGKFVKQLGDGFMLVFRQSSDAVQFAIDLQGVIARTDDLPSVRIGINTGS